MKGLVCGVGGFLLYAVLLSGTLGDPTEVCQPRNVSYNVADNKQCDKYHECTKAGKLLERLCDDGFVFSEEIHACDYPHNVNCSSRPALQPSRSTNPECERLNGFYAFPAATSCQKFHHCLEGRAYEKTCPEGVIFDPSKGTCIHPDLSKRPDCAAKSVLNFTCPNYGKKFVKLRFGDHDRLPHTTNCRKFFICLSDGKPRVGGCPLGKVFNPKLGVCDSPKRVPQCKDYYGKKDLAKLEKLAQLGEEGALEDDEIENIEDEEEAEDPTSNEAFTQEQQETEEPPQPQPQPEAPKPKSKGKKFQPQLTKRQSQEGSSSEEANQANDNSSPSNKSSSADQTSSSKNSSSGKNGQKTDDEDDDDEDD